MFPGTMRDLVVGLQGAPTSDLIGYAMISGVQWLVCIAVASSVLWLEEVRKAAVRLQARRRPQVAGPSGTPAATAASR